MTLLEEEYKKPKSSNKILKGIMKSTLEGVFIYSLKAF